MNQRAGRSLFVPEVIQTSLTDCGPAALKAVLHGFGVDVNYEWLRSRCQTDVDGTSMDALAALGRELGLVTSEILISRDSLLLPEADCLPAIVPTRSAGGATHFLVLWRTLGPYVQVMDPAGGRRWMRAATLLESISLYRFPMSTEKWKRWVRTPDATRPLEARMSRIGLKRSRRRHLLEPVFALPRWGAFARLDAAVRMVTALVQGGAIRPGPEAAAMVELLVAQSRQGRAYEAIPKDFWWASPGNAPDQLELHGVVFVHFDLPRRRSALIARSWPPSTPEVSVEGSGNHRAWAPMRPRRKHDDDPTRRALPSSIDDELGQAKVFPLQLLVRAVRFDAPWAMALLAIAGVLASAVALVDVALLRGILDIATYLSLSYQRVAGVVMLLAFTLGAMALEYYVGTLLARVGRGLEARLRVAILEKLPRFEDAYLRSRPTSDMASRAHALHMIRQGPPLASRIVTVVASYLATLTTFVWLEPSSLGLAVAAVLVGVGLPYVMRKPLSEKVARLWTHTSALDRFYLDALKGAVPLRAHTAEAGLRREHESLLVEWARTARGVLEQSTWTRGAQALAGTSIVVALVTAYVASGGTPARLLLITFFALRLPSLGEELSGQLLGSHETLNAAHRMFAPLAGKEAESSEQARPRQSPDSNSGVALAMHNVTVCATGHDLLRRINLTIRPGEHVAIVGASGAGKSSLIAVLLGWLSAKEGAVLVDGDSLQPSTLRRSTVWVDPQVALWNRSLLDNITYGAPADALGGAGKAIGAAELRDVLERLPDGLQTRLGEGGSRLSGGEGQRVRIGRALVRENVRLVLLDEAFRGLERPRRRALVQRARAAWPHATMLVVSHDVSDTLDFDRVILMDSGAIAEEGCPAELLSAPTRYRALALADRTARANLLSGTVWKRLRLEGGRLRAAAEESVER
ncbi:ATP-binding cassette domain-containing protein [Pendulispora brunnea]|uniref:ATP-binding cassette domain-containing protein n=1 Tax=Pendulispora brunnea TaxID=2905690 RepID=A0ABZ2KKG1_9BACT